MTTVCVISDLHANARALRAAVNRVFGGPCDHLVIGGDLLTYGVDIDETLELVGELQERYGATLLIGNHDQLYFDLAEGRTDYYMSLPGWIRESVDWTASRLDLAQYRGRFRWRTEFVNDGILFAHANPFRYGDWRYLNDEVSHRAAALTLQERGLRGGVFGHTHRARAFRAWDDGTGEWIRERSEPFALYGDRSRLVINAGSIGQPRERSAASTMLRLTTGPRGGQGVVEEVEYDTLSHVRSLASSDLSESTRERLCSYFT